MELNSPTGSPRVGPTQDPGRKANGKLRIGKHKKIHPDHPEFELTYDMMLGIRTTVSKTEAQHNRKLTEDDFKEENRYRFPAKGSRETPAHQQRDYKFKDYAPFVFKKIRERFGVDAAEYLLCVCGNFQFLEFISNSKSGQFFFYSHDRKYMIKTVSDQECKFLRKILPAYYKHVIDNPNTLLTPFFGLHRVHPHKKKNVHFLIMGSVFATQNYIHRFYDLKGSTQGRSATKKEKASASCVYKDLDFLTNKAQLRVGPVMTKVLMKQMAADVEFLRANNIMDYSLLLGVHSKDRKDPAEQGNYSPSAGRSASPSPRRSLQLKAAPTAEGGAGAMGRSMSGSGAVRSRRSVSGEAGAVGIYRNRNRVVNMVYADGVEPSHGSDAMGRGHTKSYGLPKRYNKFSRPGDINFTFSFDNEGLQRQRQHSKNGRVLSVFAQTEGGLAGQLDDGRPSQDIYYLGIIDILIQYGAKKKLEHAAKSLKYDRRAISAVSPAAYGKRFLKFMAAGIS